MKYWIWLSQRSHLGNRRIPQLLERFGSAEGVYHAAEEELAQIPNLSRSCIHALMDKYLGDAEEILKQCKEKQIQVLCYGDEAYPQRLRGMMDPPVVLYYQGKIPAVDAMPVAAVIGTRKASVQGCQNAMMMGATLAESGCLVVSGGAKGIDTMALRGAMVTGKPVVCVLGSGVDVPYPEENEEMLRDIANNGWLVSEYPPGTPPFGHNFPVRNRIISGLSACVVVVEAGERSGALITASHALEQGRDVFVVAAPGSGQLSEGAGALLSQGAFLADTAWDILREYAELFPNTVKRLPLDAPFGAVHMTPSRQIASAVRLPVVNEDTPAPTAEQLAQEEKAIERYLAAREQKMERLSGLLEAQSEQWRVRREERQKAIRRLAKEARQTRQKKITGAAAAAEPLSREPKAEKKKLDNKPGQTYSDVQTKTILSSNERIIVETLAAGPCQIDDLIARSALASGKVLSVLTMLQIKGVVTQRPGKIFALTDQQ